MTKLKGQMVQKLQPIVIRSLGPSTKVPCIKHRTYIKMTVHNGTPAGCFSKKVTRQANKKRPKNALESLYTEETNANQKKTFSMKSHSKMLC